VTHKSLVSLARVGKGLDCFSLRGFGTHCDAQLASTNVDASENLDFRCSILFHITLSRLGLD